MMVYLINPKSGRGLGQKLLNSQVDGTMVSIDPPRISEQLVEHVSPGDDIVVAGGDGTFSLVIGALFKLNWQQQVTLYLFPIGTGNDLARSLGMPGLKAMPTTAAWKSRFTEGKTIPVWKYGDHYFVNYLSWGMDAMMLAEVEGFRKIFPGNVALRKMAFTLASIQHIDYFVQSASHLLIDGREYDLQGKAGVIISNLPYYLGGSLLSTVAPENPLLSITFIHHVTDLIRLGFSRNRRKKRPVLPFITSNRIQLIGPDLPMQIDGEVGIYQETVIEYAGSIVIRTPAS